MGNECRELIKNLVRPGRLNPLSRAAVRCGVRNRVALAFVLGTILAIPASAQDPEAATVYIRVIGDVRVLTSGENRLRQERLLELPRLEIATGSGVIISPNGHVLTNHHVIQGEKMNVVFEGQKLEVEITVQGLEVVLPSQKGPSGGAGRYGASVYASDATLDLAVLTISAPETPFAGLGDSDAVMTGDSVRAIGYPLGDRVEIGKTAPVVIPDASVTSGSISAIRRDDRGEPRYLQTSAALNSGNSGGPLVDVDGNVVGIAQAVMKNATSVGFAIPINIVKTFLRERGLDASLQAPLLTLGPLIEPTDRGVRLRVPEGFREESAHRLRINASGGEPAPALHIDRIAGTATIEQIETALLASDSLERYRASGPARRLKASDRPTRRAISGWSLGSDPSAANDLAMVYTIIDLNSEKLVARYIGSRQAIAMNRSILQQSLGGIEAAPLLTAELTRAIDAAWTAGVATANGTLPAPQGWTIESGAPSACGGLPAPQGSIAMSPADDFTVQLRAAWWPDALPNAAAIARACSRQAGPLGDSSYVFRGQWWGEPYEARGIFVNGGSGSWHLEVTGPARKMSYVTALFERWVTLASGK